MIDKLQQIAQNIRLLSLPAVALGIACVVVVLAVLLLSQSKEWDHWFIPAFVGLLWSVSTYSFIATFREVPAQAETSLGFFARLKRRFARGWYWFIGVAFLGTSLAVLFFTVRMVSIWLKAYGA